MSAQVLSCCVYVVTKQSRQCMKDNDQLCLTIRQIRALAVALLSVTMNFGLDK